MNHRLFLRTLMAIPMFVIPAIASMHAYSQTIVYVVPSTMTVTVGQTFFVSINISNVIDLYGWEFKLKWNSTLIDVLNVTEGNFLKSGGVTFFSSITNNTEGYTVVDCLLLGNIMGVDGSGTLAIVEFKAESAAESILNLCNTKLVNSLEQPIDHTANNGTVTVTGSNTVGGIYIPVNKLELLAPYFGSAILLAATVAAVVFFRHKKKP